MSKINKDSVIRRKSNKANALFIDGVSLDRACKRLKRKIVLAELVKSLSEGHKFVIARYYTLIPYEDDSRHRAYLDAIEHAGLEVIVKRLPPKTVSVQVDLSAEMSADMIAFALGQSKLLNNLRHRTEDKTVEKTEAPDITDKQKIIKIVCPTRSIAYPIAMAGELGAKTISVDFQESAGSDTFKNASEWIDLSDSEGIWK